MEKYLVIILSSTLLSGIVTSLVSFINNIKNNRLKYITEDRRKWREEIRIIVDELNNIKYPNQIRCTLAKLKVRINPYGRGQKNDYIHDSHIWELIDKIEVNPCKGLRENKERLVFFLALLLKYDWDRAKEEVNGSISNVILFVTLAFGIFFLSYNHFIKFNFVFDRLFLTTFIIFLILPIALPIFLSDDVISSIKGKVKSQGSIWKSVIAGAKYVIAIVILIFGIIVNVIYIFQSYNISLEYLNSSGAYLEVFIVLGVMTVIWIIMTNKLTDNYAKKYVESIQEVIT